MRDGYALYSPLHGWWIGRPGGGLVDSYSQSLVDACVFSREDDAVSAGAALCERLDGDSFWVYHVFFVRRRVGRGI